MRNVIRKIIAVVAFSAFFGTIIVDGQVSASTGSIVEKWMFMGFYNCLNSGVVSPIERKSNNDVVADEVFANNSLPSQYMFTTGISKYDTMDCSRIYKGSNSAKGILGYAQIEPTTTWASPNAGSLLEKTGYVASSSTNEYGEKESTIYIRLIKQLQTRTYMGSIGYDDPKNVGEPTLITAAPIAAYEKNGSVTYAGGGATGGLKVKLSGNELTIYVVGEKDAGVVVQLSGSSLSDTKSVLQGIDGRVLEGSWTESNEYGQQQRSVYTISTSFEDGDVTSGSIVADAYNYNGRPDLSLYNLSNGRFPNSTMLLLSEDETYELYESYINAAFGNVSNANSRMNCSGKSNANMTEIHMKYNGEWRIYYADLSKASQNNFIVQTPGLQAELQDLNYIIQWLNSHPAEKFEENEECGAPDEGVRKDDIDDAISGVDGQTTDGDPSSICYENADVLGHTLCPILSAVSQFTDAIFYYIENNFLMVSVTTGDSGPQLQKAWGMVRDVANVGFVIVLLVVIFSQVTGVGIDNYGIKRILPRLIVTAVLVNISFLICQVLVDISNIVGVNIKDFLSTAIPLQAETIGASGGAEGILGTIAAGGILGGVGAAALFLNPGIILSLVAGIIGVVVALLFMFVILIARQIGIVLLIILSPIAFICYMLPNTEKIFGTWKKIFIALLLAYPICALAMGGGTMVGNILANTGDVSNNAVLLIGAMIVNVLPFFFIPTILRRSMAGLGNLGSAISGLGQRLGRGLGGTAAGGIKRTGAFNNLNAAANERQSERFRTAERNRLQRRVNRLNADGGPKNARQTRQLALAQSRLNAMNAEDATAAVGIKEKSYDEAFADATARRFQEDVNTIKTQATNDGIINNLAGNSNYDGIGDEFAFDDPSTLEAHAYQAALNGDKEGIYAYTELLSSKGHAGQEGATQVISKLQAQGKNAEAQMMAQAIMNNPNLSGQYKSGARSQYNGLKDLAAAKQEDLSKVANIRSVSNIHAGDYSKQSLANADKEELARIEAAMKDPNFKDAAKFKEMATGALNDSMIEGGTKLKNEEIMKKIAGVPANEGTIQVQHANSRFRRLSNDQLLDAATRPGVDSGTANRAMKEIERRQKDGTMKV